MSRFCVEEHDTTGTDAESASQPAADLELALHCAAPDPILSAVRLRSGMTFGRGELCSVRLASAAASRHHATIRLRGALWWCDDASSRNGTFLNGRSIQGAPIAPGDVLRFGECVWVVARVPAAAPPRRFEEFAPGMFGGELLQQALDPARIAAASSLPIIIQGETGSGKERAAAAIHAWSRRSGGYVGVNCAALVGSIAEAQLFGYRKGAFTGADRAHDGFIRAADRGTLLLDEICELPMSVQAKLLRALEDQTVVPVGESRPVPVDVRIVAASQAPLDALVAAGRFRADLFARLKGLLVTLPPLRDRREDIAALLRVFLTRLGGGKSPTLQPRFVEAVLIHGFPDNVRGLWQLARQLVSVHGHEPDLRRSHLPEEIRAASGTTGAQGRSPHSSGPTEPEAALGDGRNTPHTATEDDWPALLDALKTKRGNVAQAAALVGLSRHQAYRLMRGQGFTDLRTLRRLRG